MTCITQTPLLSFRHAAFFPSTFSSTYPSTSDFEVSPYRFPGLETDKEGACIRRRRARDTVRTIKSEENPLDLVNLLWPFLLYPLLGPLLSLTWSTLKRRIPGTERPCPISTTFLCERLKRSVQTAPNPTRKRYPRTREVVRQVIQAQPQRLAEMLSIRITSTWVQWASCHREQRSTE